MSTYYNDEKQFDADKFRYSYTSLTGSDPGLRSLLLEQLCQLHEFYSVAFQCGAFQFGSCRMLEYGGGPSQVHPLKIAELWRSNSKSARDLSDLFEHVVGELEGSKARAQEREDTLRSVISQIIPCDITKSEVISDVTLPFDIISTHFCLICGCTLLEEYRKGLEKLALLLGPGDCIVMTEA
ncbi:indolethylamine N-methyltransferase-like [Corticium candelabrum]|uniref:indolethylamine N-methyltransferase-like n=1 Tax=Corticium candelabrum TaxID=121492 RepID=UPI002E26CCED|nr:indolethylamine N-methyltransferase-like [Corticium candelabrum]